MIIRKNTRLAGASPVIGRKALPARCLGPAVERKPCFIKLSPECLDDGKTD
jgi:hypothetical protein